MIETAIRPARAGDAGAIDRLLGAAFGGPDEGALVAGLRADGDVLVELVALRDDEIVGQILFSPLVIGSGPQATIAAALAPVAVLPAHQRARVGTRLVEAGLSALRARSCPAAVVLGHPDWYPRFGFSAALSARLVAPFHGPAFMALELVPGALAAGGPVRYARAFGLVPSQEEPAR